MRACTKGRDSRLGCSPFVLCCFVCFVLLVGADEASALVFSVQKMVHPLGIRTHDFFSPYRQGCRRHPRPANPSTRTSRMPTSETLSLAPGPTTSGYDLYAGRTSRYHSLAAPPPASLTFAHDPPPASISPAVLQGLDSATSRAGPTTTPRRSPAESTAAIGVGVGARHRGRPAEEAAARNRSGSRRGVSIERGGGVVRASGTANAGGRDGAWGREAEDGWWRHEEEEGDY